MKRYSPTEGEKMGTRGDHHGLLPLYQGALGRLSANEKNKLGMVTQDTRVEVSMYRTRSMGGRRRTNYQPSWRVTATTDTNATAWVQSVILRFGLQSPLGPGSCVPRSLAVQGGRPKSGLAARIGTRFISKDGHASCTRPFIISLKAQ